MTLLRSFLDALWHLDRLMADPRPEVQNRVLAIEALVVILSAMFFRGLRGPLT